MGLSSRLQDENRASAATAAAEDDRRTHMRLSAADVLWLEGVRIKYGADVRVVDISVGGILIETDSELQPHATIVLEVSVADSTMLVPARVLRCHPLERGVKQRYQAACAFKRPLSIPDLISPSVVAPALPGPPAAVAAPSAAPLSTAPTARAIGQKVIARFLDGRIVRGYTNDFNASKGHLHLTEDGASSSQFIKLGQLKALFFVREFAGDASRVDRTEFAAATQGRKVEVTFKDGEVLVGSTLGFKGPDHPFFVNPADANSNNLRVFVPAAATRRVRLLQ